MGQDRITPEERAAIDRAVADGLVEVVEPRTPAKLKKRKPLPVSGREPAGKIPPASRIPDAMSVKEALEWAFCTEKAGFEFDEIGASSGGHRKGISMEQLILERHMLGNVAIDTSPGRSSPAEDAEIIASIVRAVLPWHAACFVADHARSRREPDWMRHADPRLIPVEWVYGRGGRRGRTADASRLGCEGWPHWQRRNRKGVVVEEVVLFTPVTWTLTSRQIAAARRVYLDWWGYLLEVGAVLRSAGLSRFQVTSDMPPMAPWRQGD